MACIRKTALLVNCGYARVSIHENSNPGIAGPQARQTINVQHRMNEFASQFSTYPEYGIPSGYFEVNGKDNSSPFDRDSRKILDGIRGKFRSEIGAPRDAYVNTFSSKKWSELPDSEKKEHRLSNCTQCFELHEELQASFPLKPVHRPEQPIVTVHTDALQRQGVKAFTTNLLAELDRVYNSEANTSFTDALLKTKTSGLERKKTKEQKRKEKRATHRELTKKVSEHFAEKATITLLVEGESKRKYHRKRIAQSFCSPEEGRPKSKRTKTHSPNFGTVQWDTETLETTLRNWPTGVLINWSTVAREHGIQGGNLARWPRSLLRHMTLTCHTQQVPQTLQPGR